MNTPGSIPFSWENKPGIRKDFRHEILVGGARRRPAKHDNSDTGEGRRVAVYDNASTGELRLPPPSCESLNKDTSQDLALPPPPPCVFRPRLRSSSRRSKDDDPFLMAYKECTKTNRKGTLTRKSLIFGSCKYSSSVRDDSIVKVSQIPVRTSMEKDSTGFNQ